MASFSLSAILDKMASPDKDYRFMAMSDLIAELGKEAFRLDANGEQRTVATVLRLLRDTSNNVQELAVKAVGPLARKLRDAFVLDLGDALADLLLREKADELRDVATMALRGLVAALPQAPDAPLSAAVQKRLAPRLVQAVQEHDAAEVRAFCMDVLNDLLARYGANNGGGGGVNGDALAAAALPLLRSASSPLRKRAIVCVGLLAGALPEAGFAALVAAVLDGAEQTAAATARGEQTRAFVQCIGALGGPRMGAKHLARAVSLIAKHCDNPKSNQDDELRENCFQTFETLLARCPPKDTAQFVPQIVELCVKYVRYDPNYAADDEGDETPEPMDEDGDEDAMEGDEEDEEEEEEDEEGYSDDDDLSWKVRRSSAKCLGAIIATRGEIVASFHPTVSRRLLARFREREENVKLDVFSAFSALLRQTGAAVRRGSASPELLSVLIPKTVSAISRQLREKSLKTRAAAFSLAKDIVTVAPGSLSAGQVSILVPSVVFSLGDRATNSTLKVEALTFLRMLLASHNPDAFSTHAAELVPPVSRTMTDNYFRIAAEGLRVGAELVGVIRCHTAQQQAEYGQQLYTACVAQMHKQDTDLDVKEAALHCAGAIASGLGQILPEQVQKTLLPLLLERVRSEVTRMAAVRVVARVAAAPEQVAIAPLLADFVNEIAALLRKSNRQLRQGSLMALSAILEHHGRASASVLTPLLPGVIFELCPLLSDADLFLGHLAAQLASLVLRTAPAPMPPAVVSAVQERLLPRMMEFVRSSLLQGIALQSLLRLFSDLASLGPANVKQLTLEALIDQLLALAQMPQQIPAATTAAPPMQQARAGSLSKQALSSIAQAVAAVAGSTKTAQQRDAVVARLVRDVQRSHDDAVRAIGLMCLGEIGRKTDLTTNEPLIPAVLAALDSAGEDVRHAASFALGNLAVGAMAKLMPFILEQIAKASQQVARQYLLLHSLREAIVRQQQTDETAAALLRPFLPAVLQLLAAHSESEEDGTRNVVGECLGKLAAISPAEVLPEIVARAAAPSAAARATAVAAVKYAVGDRPRPEADALLAPRMEGFTQLVADSDVSVRRAALLTLNYVARHRPDLVRSALASAVPGILAETRIRPELIREVDLGPFKHRVDDGVETRKAAFECLNTLLDTALDSVNVHALLERVASGMSDHYDVKVLSHQILARIAGVAGGALMESLDAVILDPLRETITSKAKDTAVKQEVERNDELVRSALRATAAISKAVMPAAEAAVPKFRDFMRTVVLGPEFAERFREASKSSDDAFPSAAAAFVTADTMDTSA